MTAVCLVVQRSPDGTAQLASMKLMLLAAILCRLITDGVVAIVVSAVAVVAVVAVTVFLLCYIPLGLVHLRCGIGL